MTISVVPPEATGIVLTQVRPMLERALSRGEGRDTTLPDIYDAAFRGDIMVWAIHEGAEIVAVVGLRIIQKQTHKVVHVDFAAGKNMGGWIEQTERLLAEYRDVIGAKAVRASCRNGMARFLSRRGWGKVAVIMEYSA